MLRAPRRWRSLGWRWRGAGRRSRWTTACCTSRGPPTSVRPPDRPLRHRYAPLKGSLPCGAGIDVLQPWLCADGAGGLGLNCALASHVWRWLLLASCWAAAAALTKAALVGSGGRHELRDGQHYGGAGGGDCRPAVQALLCVGLGRLARCALLACTALGLPRRLHSCRLDPARREECAEHWLRLRATLAISLCCVLCDLARHGIRPDSATGRVASRVVDGLGGGSAGAALRAAAGVTAALLLLVRPHLLLSASRALFLLHKVMQTPTPV